LLGIGRAQIRIQTGSKSNRQNCEVGYLPSSQEGLSGGTRSRAAHCRLNEAAINRGHSGEQELSVGLIAGAEPLNVVKCLPDAGNQAIVINAKPAANHTVFIEGLGKAGARLPVVEVGVESEASGIGFKIIA